MNRIVKGSQDQEQRADLAEVEQWEAKLEQLIKRILLSVAEIRRLLWKLLWATKPLTEFVPGTRLRVWSTWRRRHQAIARACHYQRRFNDLQL
jgi:hypothetical protein